MANRACEEMLCIMALYHWGSGKCRSQLQWDSTLHFVRMGTHQKATNNLRRCLWVCGERGPLYIAGGSKLMQPLWAIVWGLPKSKYRTAIWSVSFTSGIYMKKSKTPLIWKAIWTPVFIAKRYYSSHDVEAAQVLIDTWVDKEALCASMQWNARQPLKKEAHAICDSIDGSRGHCAKSSVSDRERQMPVR